MYMSYRPVYCHRVTTQLQLINIIIIIIIIIIISYDLAHRT
jgi:hypothetical protein